MLRKKNDVLLKAAFEETFAFLLEFFFKNAKDIFDMKRGFVFMDKELREIFPELKKKGGTRHADMLAKVFMKDGSEKWILVHIEIQDKVLTDFPKRMFRYYYRILDRFEVGVTSIAVITGKAALKENIYFDALLGTEVMFKYNAFHVLNHTEAELLAMNNPFALVVLAAQKAIFANTLPEIELGNARLTIAKALIESKKYNHQKMQVLLYFLKNYLYVESPEININFDKQINVLTNQKKSMGILETIKMQEREEGELIGKRIGKKIGEEAGKQIGKRESQTTIIKNLLLNTDFPVAKIASLADVSEVFVLDIKKSLAI